MEKRGRLDATNAADIFRVFRLFSDKRAYEKPCGKYCRKQRREQMEQYNEILKAEDVFARIKKHWEENYGRG